METNPNGNPDTINPGNTSTSRGIPKILWLSVPFVIAGLLLGSWHYWTTTPTYALTQIRNAVQEKNSLAFYQYFDVDRVVDSVVDGVMSAELAKKADQDDKLGALGAAFGAGIVNMLKPQIKNLVKHQIEQKLSSDESSDQGVSNAKGFNPKKMAPFEMIQHSKAISLGEIIKIGNSATVDVKIKPLKTDYVLQIKMERVDNWKIVGFQNLSSVIEKFNQEKAEILEAKNKEIRDRINGLITFRQGKVNKLTEGWSKTLSLAVKFTNNSNYTLKRIVGKIGILSDQKVIGIYNFDENTPLNPTEESFFFSDHHANQFDKTDMRVFNESNPEVRFMFDRVDFEDAESIATVNDLDGLI